jgi:hypothetical protein
VPVVQALMPDSCCIVIGEPSDAFSIGLHMLGTKPLGLVDGKFTTLLSAWFGSLGICKVYATCQQCRAINAAPKPASVPQIAPRDASTVLSIKGTAYHYRQAPAQGHTENFDCVNVGTAERSVYHGGGWLPAPLTKVTRVLTPYIYATKHSWANQTLSCDERLVSNEAPAIVFTALQPHHSVLDTDVFAGLIPGKCLTGSRSLGEAPEIDPK